MKTTLESEGFQRKFFYVPFSNSDYPKYEDEEWSFLCEKAHKTHTQDFTEDCEEYCDEHHIGSLNAETIKNCFEMPATGVMVKHHFFERALYPFINNSYFDSTVPDYIGHFCSNNGKVVFIYRNGKTYVAKGYKILNELRAAGYVEKGLFVPFSNGEEIQDPVLKARWESITKF